MGDGGVEVEGLPAEELVLLGEGDELVRPAHFLIYIYIYINYSFQSLPFGACVEQRSQDIRGTSWPGVDSVFCEVLLKVEQRDDVGCSFQGFRSRDCRWGRVASLGGWGLLWLT